MEPMTNHESSTGRDSFRRFVALVLLVVILSGTGMVAAAQVLEPATTGGENTASSVAQPDATADSDIPRVAPLGPNAGLKLTPQEMDLLAHIINGESRGEPFLGQVAVGAVVLNRVRAGGEYGSTVAEVIYRPGQFEPVRNGQINLSPTESCLLAARVAAQGQDPTGGALYFWQPDKTFSAYLWSRPLKIEIGCHRFTE